MWIRLLKVSRSPEYLAMGKQPGQAALLAVQPQQQGSSVCQASGILTTPMIRSANLLLSDGWRHKQRKDVQNSASQQDGGKGNAGNLPCRHVGSTAAGLGTIRCAELM